MPSSATLELRCRLLLEEVFEFIDAAGFSVLTFDDKPFDVKTAAFEPYTSPDMYAMVDAIADIDVVNTGTAIALGVSMDPVLDEVDNNNLLKIATGRRNELTGKFEKHVDHPLPDIEGVLQAQGWRVHEHAT